MKALLLTPITGVLSAFRDKLNRTPSLPAAKLKFDRNRPRVIDASGFIDKRQRQGTKRIAITFDDAMFATIAARAKADGVAFAEEARRLIEKGLGT